MEEFIKDLALGLGFILAIGIPYIPIGYGYNLHHSGKSMQEYRRFRQSFNDQKKHDMFAYVTYPGYRFGVWLHDVTQKLNNKRVETR